jgi:hypothetical protein
MKKNKLKETTTTKKQRRENANQPTSAQPAIDDDLAEIMNKTDTACCLLSACWLGRSWESFWSFFVLKQGREERI